MGGVAILAGVGFTIALLVADLSYGSAGPGRQDREVLLGSVVAALLASVVLRRLRHFDTAARHPCVRGHGFSPLVSRARNRERPCRPQAVVRREGEHMTSNAPMTPRQSTVATVTEEEPTIGRLVADASQDHLQPDPERDRAGQVEAQGQRQGGRHRYQALRGSGGHRRAGDHHALGRLRLLPAHDRPRPGWCFLIVFGAYLLIAALLGFLGMKKVKQVRAPERAIHQAQEAGPLQRK